MEVKAEWFAGRLRELREQAGLSRKELAERAGFQSEGGIRNLEQGIRKPSWDTVLALCRALDVDCNAFMVKPADQSPAPPRGRPRKPTEAPASDQEKPARTKGTTAAASTKGKRKKGE